MDIKEIVNLLYTAIDLAADGGPAAFTDEEYSEMHELLKKIKSGQFGWHPASELPELNEYGNSELVYVLYGTNNSRLSPIISCVIEGKWHDDNIKWWCYPPIND